MGTSSFFLAILALLILIVWFDLVRGCLIRRATMHQTSAIAVDAQQCWRDEADKPSGRISCSLRGLLEDFHQSSKQLSRITRKSKRVVAFERTAR